MATLGDAAKKLYDLIARALLCYSQTYSGGRPSMHDPGRHSAKFAKGAVEEIRCHSLRPEHLPLSLVKKRVEDLAQIPISKLEDHHLPYFERLQEEISRLSRTVEKDCQDLLDAQKAEGEAWKAQPSLESHQAVLLQSILGPLRALVLLLQVVYAPQGSTSLPKMADLECPLSPIGAENKADLVFKTSKLEKTPAFTIELKLEEALSVLEQQSNWLHLVCDYLTQQVVFSNRPEHQEMFEFDPTSSLYQVKHKDQRTTSRSKHVPSDGVRTPARPINNSSLYRIAMQALGYAYDASSGGCLLTNLLYDHVLLQYVKNGATHLFYVFDISTSRPFSPANISQVIDFYVYICDHYMTSSPLFPPPSFPPPHHVRGESQVSQPTTEGRPWYMVPFSVLSNCSLFSAVASTFGPIFTLLLIFWLRFVKPTFTMYSVGRQPVIRYEFLRYMRIGKFMQLHLVFKKRSRQGVILAHPTGLFIAKVFAEASTFSAELNALTTLADVTRVPKILGTGSTVAGDKFILISDVGEALPNDVTEEQAQIIWDTVLKHVHARNIHHHDIVYHNITRDAQGVFHLIDFGESGPACAPEIEDCADRAWLNHHNVRL